MGFIEEESNIKKRTHYELGNICFEIDEFEGLPPYLEIETHSEKDMEDICKKLNLDINKGDNRVIIEIYPEKFQT